MAREIKRNFVSKAVWHTHTGSRVEMGGGSLSFIMEFMLLAMEPEKRVEWLQKQLGECATKPQVSQ